jgi:methylated-DNA-protein-cysteine methyltransferase related protein
MATSPKKSDPTKRKAAAGSARKAASKRSVRKKGSGIAAVAKAGKPAAPRKSAAKSSPREKLIAVRPSGSKDDSFFDLVHEVARQIPSGRVTSYGAIAACLGTRMSARMVGWAMMTAPLAQKPVPAHRVVNRNGLLTGKHHYNPPERMQQLLEKEGVAVNDDQVVDFKKLFWDPAQEL